MYISYSIKFINEIVNIVAFSFFLCFLLFLLLACLVLIVLVHFSLVVGLLSLITDHIRPFLHIAELLPNISHDPGNLLHSHTGRRCPNFLFFIPQETKIRVFWFDWFSFLFLLTSIICLLFLGFLFLLFSFFCVFSYDWLFVFLSYFLSGFIRNNLSQLLLCLWFYFFWPRRPDNANNRSFLIPLLLIVERQRSSLLSFFSLFFFFLFS